MFSYCYNMVHITEEILDTPQPLYNTIAWTQSQNNVCLTTVLYPKTKCIDYIEK